jgi:adenine-specific DNA-methyltransferase
MPSGKRVRVHLVAASSEQDNKKETPGKERRFILCEDNPIYEENGELFIRFEYRPDDGKSKQDALNKEAIKRILGAEEFEEWIRELSKLAPTKANPNRTVLEKHLTQYTARNTFDYFIHKDLGGFLRRELDFYIKNEVMHLDDN